MSYNAIITKILDNGKCIKLAPEKPKICGYLNTGKLIVEGRNLYDSESNFIKDRRKISFEGMILISIIINTDLSINNKIMISKLNILLAKFSAAFLSLANSPAKLGIKAALNVPSANNLLNVLGNLKAKKKASAKRLVPKKNAINISLM